MSTVPIFAPDGTLGDIPADQLMAAVKAGAKPGVHITSPDGKDGVIPADRTREAVQAGAKIVPIQDQPVQHPGFWALMGSDLKGLLTPRGFNPYPGMGQEEKSEAAAEAGQQDLQRKQEGRSLAYRVGVPFAESVGANVPGMEQAAREGDVGGVLGHAAAPVAALATAEALREGVPAAVKAVGPVDPYSVPARVARTAGNLALDAAKDIPVVRTLGKAGEAWRSTAPPIEPPTEAPLIVRQAGALARGPQVVIDPAAGLGQISVKAPGQAGSMVQSVATPTGPVPSNFPTAASRAASDAAFARNFPNETMPEGMTPQEKEIWQQTVFGEKPQGDIGAKVRQANPEPTRAEVKAASEKVTPQRVQAAAEEALGVKKLQPDIPLKQQTGVISKGPAIPEGHTPVESSALRSYKYDASAREFTAATRAGNVQYVYGDVSPEDAAAFDKAESKGKAWQDIRQNPLVAKIVDGKRIPIKPSRSIVVDPETGKPEFSDMTDALKKSVQAAKAKKLSTGEGAP